jgi:hypothetical protein
MYNGGPIEEGVFAMYTVKEGWMRARYNTHVTHPACMYVQHKTTPFTAASPRFGLSALIVRVC